MNDPKIDLANDPTYLLYVLDSSFLTQQSLNDVFWLSSFPIILKKVSYQFWYKITIIVAWTIIPITLSNLDVLLISCQQG